MPENAVETIPPGEVEEMGPWNIRSISARLRKAVALAAQAEGLSVGDWLGVHLRWVVDGEQPHQNGGNLPVPTRFTPPSNKFADVPALVREARELAAMTEYRRDRESLLTTARITLRAALLAPRRPS